MNALERFGALLNRLLIVLGGVALLGMTLLATGNILLRVFNVPYRGAYEVVSLLGALVVAFSLGYTQQKKDHIVVDILSGKFPPRVKRLLDGVTYAVTGVFFAVIARQIALWGMKIKESGELSETLQIIYYPFVFCVAAGCAVLSLTLFVQLLKTLAPEGERKR